MVISNELIASLYGSEALQRATLSYQNGQTANAINSEWYYNLGMSQAFNGTVHLGAVNSIAAENNGRPYLVLMGDQQIDGVVITTLFTTDGTASGQLIGVNGTEAVLQTLANGDPCIPETNVADYTNYRYAQYNPTIANQAGYYDGTDAEPVQEPFLLAVAHYDATEQGFVHTEEEFVRIEHSTPDDDTTALVAVTADGTKRYIISGETTNRSYGMALKAKSAAAGEHPFTSTPSYQNEGHKLSNDDTQFIVIAFSEDLTGAEDLENWNTLKGMGFKDSIWLYQ